MKTNRARERFRINRRWLCLLIVLAAATRDLKLYANPHGMKVVVGSATAQANGSQLNVTTSQFTFLNWSSFNIQQGENTTFIQPSSSSIVFNNIGDSKPSQIWGSLNANGTVILANSHGFSFGPNSFIQVGGSFIATTAPIAPDFGAGATWQFTGLPPLASIVNYGRIEVGKGSSLFLIAENVENHGELRAPSGNVGLYSGKEVLLSERPDGRGLSATVRLPSGSVDNSGKIVADGGSIALQAQVVNQNGIIQADSVRKENGVIELVASDQLNLGANSQILAHGDDASRGSAGGRVTLKSDNVFSDDVGSAIDTSGGARGGNGGNVEISAPNILSLNSRVNAGAQTGWVGGLFALDPINIILGTSGSTGADGSGTIDGSGAGPGTLNVNVNTAFQNITSGQILLEASGNITLAANAVWDLSQSTGLASGHLGLQAGGDIVFNNGSQIVDANNWSVNLQAGINFASGTVQSGAGNIYLNGGSGRTLNGSIQLATGNIDLTAGQSILVGGGFVRTTAGGSINATAQAGDINAGTANGGYQFSIFGYSVSPNLGGISTAAGGDVTLNAGNNIISIPTVPVNQPPGASGAYGSQPGNVTLIAGNQVLGNFTVANGMGTILAGVQVQNGQVSQTLNPNADVGSSQRPVNLGLIDGSWNVWAARDIYVGEVRNPNGTFNGNQLNVPAGQFPGNIGSPNVPARAPFLFDYAPDAAANFWAGNSITLAGANLPRVSGQNQSMPPVYAPILNLNAGAGGINILNSLILFPSAEGALHITTRDGGSLVGAPNATSLVGITVSDSGLPGWATFGQGHAVVPLHIYDPNPVTLNISGGIQSFSLMVPTFATINVGGDTYNFGFAGRNLSPSQTTSINVAGDINYRGNLTSVALTDPLPSVLLNASLSGDPEVAGRLRYDAATGTLTFIGQMTQVELAFLLNPTVALLDKNGRPVLDGDGQLILVPIALDTTQLGVIQQLYAASQSATLSGQVGLALAGSGQFNIDARNINLGISGGISVLAPDQALAAISPLGANVDIHTSGNLDMTSSKIANDGLLGDINLDVGGTLDVGGQLTTFGDPGAPKGIFTTSGGNVSVNANGNVNLNGSRIAAYDGGNITIHSEHGDVNAGSGAIGYVSFQSLELDPVSGQLNAIPTTIPGSGILATTIPGGHAALGNISVTAPNGSINASLGGIVQIAFNGADSHNSFIDLNAGHDINASGSGVIGSNIRLQAGGNITGVIVGSGNVTIDSQQNVNVTAFGGGNVNINAGGNVTGNVISGGSVDVSGDSITASLIAGSVSTSGDTSGATMGIPQANVAQDETPTTQDSAAVTKSLEEQPTEDDDKKNKNRTIALAQKISRVTLVLPEKN